MTNMLAKTKEEGVSLRLTFAIMLVVSVGITTILLLMTLRTITSFHALSRATDAYIDLQDAATSLMNASDYLTEEAQCYTVLGDRRHLENYFAEAEKTHRREEAVRVMENSLPNTKALQELKDALAESVYLMNREYYSMLLILTAQGDSDIPEAMRHVTLSEEDERLSAKEKQTLAEQMMHDTDYYEQKNLIRAHLSKCIEELKNGTHGTQETMEGRMHTDLVCITVLILMQSSGLILMLYLTTSLGINPLLQAVEHIKQDQTIPIVGAHEFRYLAGTYNKMYSIYKRSIDNLSFKASHDELTGVYNRAGYDLIKRSVELNTTAFLLFDADHFKEINDTHGHEVGDRVLKKIAKTLKENFRSDDYVCRIGGDEFMVLMVHVTPGVKKLIQHKVEQINRDLSGEENSLPPVTVSVGVALCRENRDVQEIFRETDIALYHVKDNGRNGCCFYTPGMGRKGEIGHLTEKMNKSK